MPAPSPFSVAVGDFNSDNKPDLAVVNISPGLVSVFLGNGDGTFQAAANYEDGGVNSDFVAVGDFNLDGKPDLAIANDSYGSASVLLGNGDGTFLAVGPFPAGQNPFSLAAGDFDSDGKPDLAVANYTDNNVSVLVGQRGRKLRGAGELCCQHESPLRSGERF